MSAQTKSAKDTIEILIVEDSLTQQSKLKHLLERHHYSVTTANNGKQALVLLSARKPTLVISDIAMPEMDGYTFCKRLKSDKSSQNIPVILLTSLSNSEDVLEGLACGADNFIPKPYDNDYLISSIRQMLANKDLCGTKSRRVEVEVTFAGKKRLITADHQQILNLLLSTYEAAVGKNTELLQTQEKLRSLNDRLENLVEQRTKALSSEDETREYAESIINTVREPLIALDQDLRVVSVSRSFYEVFKVNPKETVGQLIYDLGNKQWDIPKLRELLETILPQKASFDNYEVEHDFTTIGRRIMLLNARQIQRASGKERIILLAIEDITERREIEIGNRRPNTILRRMVAEHNARIFPHAHVKTIRGNVSVSG